MERLHNRVAMFKPHIYFLVVMFMSHIIYSIYSILFIVMNLYMKLHINNLWAYNGKSACNQKSFYHCWQHLLLNGISKISRQYVSLRHGNGHFGYIFYFTSNLMGIKREQLFVWNLLAMNFFSLFNCFFWYQYLPQYILGNNTEFA